MNWRSSLTNGAVEFSLEGNQWHCKLPDYWCATVEKEEAVFPRWPLGRVTRGDNLLIRSVSDGHEIALTGDGEPDWRVFERN